MGIIICVCLRAFWGLANTKRHVPTDNTTSGRGRKGEGTAKRPQELLKGNVSKLQRRVSEFQAVSETTIRGDHISLGGWRREERAALLSQPRARQPRARGAAQPPATLWLLFVRHRRGQPPPARAPGSSAAIRARGGSPAPSSACGCRRRRVSVSAALAAAGPAGLHPRGRPGIAGGGRRAGAAGRPPALTAPVCVCICSRKPGGSGTHREGHGRGRVSGDGDGAGWRAGGMEAAPGLSALCRAALPRPAAGAAAHAGPGVLPPPPSCAGCELRLAGGCAHGFPHLCKGRVGWLARCWGFLKFIPTASISYFLTLN